MFGDFNNYYDDEETLELLRRYKEMLLYKNNEFFDLYEFENIIDYFTEQYNFQDALQVVCTAIKQHPNATSLKLKHAQLLIETLKPGKALRIIKSLHGAEEDNYELFLTTGIALNMTGKLPESQLAFNRSLKLCECNKDEVAYNISQSYTQIGLNEEAIKYLLLAHHYNKYNILVIYDLALSYDKIDNTEKSIYYYNLYLEIDPFAEHVWNNLGLLYTKIGKYRPALEAFDYSIALNPQFIPSYYCKADLLVMCKSYTAAIDIYKDLLKEDIGNSKTMYDLGNCYMYVCNYSEALKMFKAATEISKEYGDAWYGVSLVYFKQKRYALSINKLKKAISIESHNPVYWYMLGEIYSKMRKLNKAIKAFSRAHELNPANYQAILAYAQILFRKKRIEEAILILLNIYNCEPDNSLINYRLAAYYAYEQKMEEAQHFFKRALILNFSQHIEMFRHFPKTKSMLIFKSLVNSTTEETSSLIN